MICVISGYDLDQAWAPRGGNSSGDSPQPLFVGQQNLLSNLADQLLLLEAAEDSNHGLMRRSRHLRDVFPREADRDPKPSGDGFTVPAGEAEQEVGQPSPHVENGQGANRVLGLIELDGQLLDEADGNLRVPLHQVQELVPLHKTDHRIFDRLGGHGSAVLQEKVLPLQNPARAGEPEDLPPPEPGGAADLHRSGAEDKEAEVGVPLVEDLLVFL